MTTLVTGASGFLGRHLLEGLLARGEKVRILAIGVLPEWLRAMPVEVLNGSVTSPEVAAQAVSGVDRIYHLAGRVSRSQDAARDMYSVHVDGTRVLCQAAKAAGVGRIVLVSSSGTVAVSETAEPIPDETFPAPTAIIARWPYYVSKLYQEQVARQLCADGKPELCIVNPSLLLGPGDDRLSSTHDVLLFLRREIPLCPNGGVSFVDARDVARTLPVAMEKAPHGERYLLGGPNWTCAEFFGRLERITKVPAPRLRVPDAVSLWGARAMEAVYRRFDRVPAIAVQSVEMGRYFWYVDASKAKRELDFAARDPADTLYDTVRYLRERVLGRDAFTS